MHFLPIKWFKKQSQQYMVIFLWGCTAWISSKLWWGCTSKSVWVLHYKEDIVVLRREQNWKSAAKEGEFFQLWLESFSWEAGGSCMCLGGDHGVFVERMLLLLQGCSGFPQELHSVIGVINQLLIVNGFPLYFVKLQTTSLLNECV